MRERLPAAFLRKYRHGFYPVHSDLTALSCAEYYARLASGPQQLGIHCAAGGVDTPAEAHESPGTRRTSRLGSRV